MTETLMALCTSSKMQSIRDLVAKVAASNTTVLLRGEGGVGKEVVARAIHRASPRARKPLLTVNCAALPGDLLESELFGHPTGVLAGGGRPKPGKLEAANGGTLFLDEIGAMPLRLQAKLLHVLQDDECARLGVAQSIGSDVRFVVATRHDLEASMRAGQFREDLYYRLNVVEIHIPPLRERREEVPGLIDHFLKKFNAEYGLAITMPRDTVRLFVAYHWPGNIRELENAVKRVVVLGSARPVHAEIAASLGQGARRRRAPLGVAAAPAIAAAGTISLKDIARQAARDAERVAIKDVLDRVHWNRAKAARLLQISYKALLYKIVQCGLVRPEHEKDTEGIAS